MKRTRLFSTAAFASALLAAAAAPAALAQRGQGTGGDAPTAQNRATAEADRLHKNNGLNGGPADLLRLAQGAMRRGQTAQANELLERAETRLLLRDGAAAGTGSPARPVAGEPAHHVSEARRALLNRDRAEAMRHTNLAIATTGDGGATAAGSDAGGRGGFQGGVQGGGGPGMVDSGMGTVPAGAGRAVVRDGGTGGASASRAEGVVLAQSSGTTGPGAGTGARGGARGSNAPTGLPPGDTIPGWSGPRGGAFGGTANTAPQSQGTVPQGTPPTVTAPPVGVPSAGGTPTLGTQGLPSGPSSSSLTGGEPARVGGAPPGDTSRSPGSSGISGAGVGGSLR